MRIFIATLTILFSMVLLSCSKKEDSQEPVPQSSNGYTTISVANGGSIKGVVTSSLPISASAEIETQKDQDVCGVSHKNPAAPVVGNGLNGCIVYLERVTQGKAFATVKPELDQHGCEFKPHVQIVPVGKALTVTNSDAIVHNYHLTKGGATILNEAQPEGAPPHEVKLDAKGLVSIGCDVHPWMRGFLFMAENPYATITDTTGAFTLSDVPPGEYTIVVWRDNWNITQQKDGAGRITGYQWAPDFIKKEQVKVEASKEIPLNVSLP